MKKTNIALIMALLVFSIIPFISAEENSEEIILEDAGLVPGDNFYGIDNAFDNFKIGLIFNKERKAELALQIAEEKLLEAEKLSSEGNFMEVERAREQYEKYLSRSEKSIEKLEINGNKESTEKSLREIARIQNKVEAHKEKLNEIRTRILEKNGQNMTEEELEKLDELFSKLEAKSDEIANKAIEKRTNSETTYKVLSEMSDEELEAALEKIDSEEGLLQDREKRFLRDENRTKREIEVRERNLERAKERLNSSNLTEEQKLQIQERIAMQEKNFFEFKERKELKEEEIQEKFEERNEIREEHQAQIREAISKEIEKRNSQENQDENYSEEE